MTRSRVLACALLAASCASLTAHRARERALRRELDAFRSEQPLELLWQETRRLLAEEGYPLAARDAAAVGQKPMGWVERVTSPARETADRGPAERSLDTGWSRSRERYRAQARRDGGGWTVVFTRVSDATSDRPGGEPSRDLQMQLALVRRVDAAAAARIDGEVSAAVAGGR